MKNNNRHASGYKNQAKRFLDNSFPLISCQAINIVLNHVEFRFPDAFQILSGIQSQYPDGDARVAFPNMPPTTKVFLKNERTKKRFYVRDQRLREEIATIDELNTKENNNPQVRAAAAAEEVEEEIGEDDEETLVECGCCYSDYPRQAMKDCGADAGHKVCSDCISRFVSEQLDGNNSSVFKCIVDEACNCMYPSALLDQVLSPKLKRRANDKIFRDGIKEAGIPFWECSRCSHIGFYEPERTPKTILCPECKVIFCFSCKEKDHGKRSCDEVRQEKERLANPVYRAQEEMSRAVKRCCPGCKQTFVKRDGCNKMKCSNCKTLSCYLCGQEIPGYSHFCNHKKPCNCGKSCELWTNTNKMNERDRARRQEAGRKVLEEAGMAENEILKVLASPPAKKKVKADANSGARAGVRVQPGPPRPGAARPLLQRRAAEPARPAGAQQVVPFPLPARRRPVQPGQVQQVQPEANPQHDVPVGANNGGREVRAQHQQVDLPGEVNQEGGDAMPFGPPPRPAGLFDACIIS